MLSHRRELILLRERVAQALLLEARQRPLLATSVGLPQPESPTPMIYHAPKRWRKGMLAVAGVPIAGVLAILAVHFQAGVFPPSKPSVSYTPVPVAVFNATSTAGEAHRIAGELKADRVHLGQIGNINANLHTGVYVLYPPGGQAQARGIARLIPNLSPTIEPIRPQIQNAVGQHDEIVVIFD